jgi:hypothetical protein
MMVGVLGAWRLGWRLALAAKADLDTQESLADYEREQRAASEEIQNAKIFWNMALSNPVAATARSVALRGLSHLRPIVRRMTEKEALVTQKLYAPDVDALGEMPSGEKGSSFARTTREGR